MRTYTRKPLLERIINWTNIPSDPNGCWEWSANKNPGGYGQLRISGKTHKAHRVSFELFNGIKPKLNVLHSCDNRSCINPAHLREGTQAENVQDSIARNRHWQVRKTHCSNGHAFDFENTYLKKRGDSYKRECLACARDRMRKKYSLNPNSKFWPNS